MSGLAIARALALVAAVASLGAGCSVLESENPTLGEDARLEVTDYDSARPATRAGYADLATFVTPGGRVQIFDPGTGPSDPPRLIRTIRVRNHIVTDAQIADDGYLWVAPPDFEGGTLRVVYVVDPHTGIIHRNIETPANLSAIAGLTIGPDAVYLRAWRDGFSGGIGVVSRSCVATSTDCNVRFLSELGDVGGTPERALHYEPGALYSFNGSNSRAERLSTVRIDPSTGDERATTALSGTSTFDAESFYVLALRGPGERNLIRLDKETLREEASARIGINAFQIAHESGRLYVTDGLLQTVEVYNAATLESVETIDISEAMIAGAPEAAVGFIAPHVLILNHHSYLNTETNEVVSDAFPLDLNFSQALRLPQGHPLAF